MITLRLFVFTIFACSDNFISILREDPTDNFIKFLQTTQQTSEVEIDLGVLISQIDDGILINPIDEFQTYSDPVMLIYYEQMESFLKRDLNLEKIRTFVTTATDSLDKFKSTKNSTVDQTKDVGLIPVKKITIGKTTLAVSPYIDQYQWTNLMYQVYSEGQSLNERFDIPSSDLLTVTWLSAMDFANQISREESINPVYNFNTVKRTIKNYHRSGHLELAITVDHFYDEVQTIDDPEKWFSKLEKELESVHYLFKRKYLEMSGYRLPTKKELKYIKNL